MIEMEIPLLLHSLLQLAMLGAFQEKEKTVAGHQKNLPVYLSVYSSPWSNSPGFNSEMGSIN